MILIYQLFARTKFGAAGEAMMMYPAHLFLPLTRDTIRDKISARVGFNAGNPSRASYPIFAEISILFRIYHLAGSEEATLTSSARSAEKT